MMKVKSFFLLFILSFVVFGALPAEEEQPLEISSPEIVATNTLADDLLVEGVVCPLSGQLRLSRTDLIAPGKEPLELKRTLLSYQVPTSFDKNRDKDTYELIRHALTHYRGWDSYPQRRLTVERDGDKFLAKLPLESGTILHYEVKKGKEGKLLGKHYGMNNYGVTAPHAKYDYRNISCRLNHDGNEITVDHPNGTRLIYRGIKPTGVLIACTYRLVEETLPSGNKRCYSRTGVSSYDPTNTHLYAFIQWERHPFHGTLIKASTSTNQEVHYELEIGTAEGEYKDGWFHWNKYQSTLPPILKYVTGPLTSGETCELNPRFQVAYFESDDQIFRCTYDSNTPHQMVKTLAKPSGSHDAWEVLYTFEYTPAKAGKKEGQTHVRKSDGTYQIFSITKDLLLDAIQQYDSKGKLRWRKKYRWTPNQWLSSIETVGDDGSQLSKTSYQYDDKGNPVLETLEWDGRSKSIHRLYSKDRFHLLLKEEHVEGPKYQYEYLPGTNLLTKKTIFDGNKLVKSYEKNYDKFHNLIREIEAGSDDRFIEKVTSYKLREQEPFLHLPEWVEDGYLENGKLIPLISTHLCYDSLGRVCLREIYDAKGQFAYSQEFEYDGRGNILLETNPIGQRAGYQYDEKGRCIQELPFSGRLVIEKNYDKMGRVRSVDQIGDEGTVHSESYDYDQYDQQIGHTNYLGNTRTTHYDPICGKPEEIIYPATVAGKVIFKHSYDPFGRKISTTDANGNRTSYSYDGLGNLLTSETPDGFQKCYQYNLNSKCITYTDEEGNETLYEYDALGNLISKKELGQSMVSRYEYHGEKKILAKDPEGFSTYYFYDGAGRLSKEEREGRLKRYNYDSLGFLKCVTEHDRVNTRKICYTRDYLGREEKKEHLDTSGKVYQWLETSYDESGNIFQTRCEIDGQIATQTRGFDPFDRLIERLDAYGNPTEVSYVEDYLNSIDQYVLQTIEKNPHGTTTEKIYDSHYRLVSIKICSPKQLLSLHENGYDPKGNLTEEHDYRIASGKILEKQTLQRTFDCQDHLIELTRAFGTPIAHTTTMTYTPTGKLRTKTLPDSITLSYTYDGLGRLQNLTSSDQMVDQEFRYDLLGNLIEGRDGAITFSRTFDPFGNITKEKFSSGGCVEKNYDTFDRPISLRVGQKKVVYEYDPWFLRSARESHECLFKFIRYDASGNCLEEQLPLKLGKTRLKYEKNGRLLEISHPHFSEHYTYDALGNMIDRSGVKTQYDDLRQLTQEGQDRYQHDSLHCDCQHRHNSLNENETTLYDLNGNVSQHEGHELYYDPLGRLVKACNGFHAINFHYDALGRCLSKRVNGKLEEIYLYDGWEDIGTLDSKGNLLNFRLTTPSGITLSIEQKGSLLAALTDLQRSVRQLIPFSNEGEIQTLEYNAFGQLHSRSIQKAPWMYQSKRWLPELSLYLYSKRLYHPESHTWMTADPRLNLDSINLYQFNLNNPYSFHDPNGEFVFAIPLVVWGAEAAFFTFTATEVATYIALAATACYVYNNPEVIQNPFNTYHSRRGLPLTGEPNSSDSIDWGNGKGTIRDYDEDGKAKTDYDFGHDHNDSDDPHAHDWDWSNSDDVTPPYRPSGRPLKPGE